MTALTDFDLDNTGKVDLHAVYDRPDPRDYYQTLSGLDYRIPAAAEPIFRAVIAAERASRKTRRLTLLDVGCSYGVNAAIVKHGCALADLFAFYRAPVAAGLSRGELIARDREFFKNRVGDDDLAVIGLDAAAKPVEYAVQTCVMDAGIVADFESREPTGEEASLLAGVDLVISTGAIGYVGAPTFTHILDRAAKAPWLALFALRMFPVDTIAEMLSARGYDVFHLTGQRFRQRRFASRDEATAVLANLGDLGVDPAGREADGWYHAEFYFARPKAEDGPMPIAGLARI